MAEDATRVLVVEDDQTVADIYRLSLERAGFEVAIAADGLDCVEQASKRPPDFIFLDIRMPRMDGIEALRNLKADAGTRAVPVVMLSNFDDPGLVRQCRELGANDYLVKAGLSPADLAAVVSRWVDQPAGRSDGFF